MEGEAQGHLSAAQAANGGRRRRTAEMRYVGQIHEVEVELPDVDPAEIRLDELVERFHERHEALYTYSEPHSPCEVINLHLGISTPRPDMPLPTFSDHGPEAPAEAVKGTRSAWVDGAFAPTPVLEGPRLQPGNVVCGPAIIEEATTTILVGSRWEARLDGRGFYELSRRR
jgi:N-methylhydantoinase A